MPKVSKKPKSLAAAKREALRKGETLPRFLPKRVTNKPKKTPKKITLKQQMAVRANGLLGGRPKLWETPEDMAKDIEEVYQWCIKRKLPFTLTRLYAELDVDNNMVMYDKDPRFSAVLSRARQYAKAGYEEGLLTSSRPAGYMFAMKHHFGWRDDKHVTHTVDKKITGLMSTLRSLPPDSPIIDGEIVENAENPISETQENGSTQPNPDTSVAQSSLCDTPTTPENDENPTT